MYPRRSYLLASQGGAANSGIVGTVSTLFMDQVSKLTGTVLGVGKKPTTNQSQTLAAQAAKKVTPPLTSGLPLPQTSRPQDQEDKEKKAQRLRNQETRRLLAQQRKADEDKARLDGEQKRVKEDMERRKREREETTDKRPIKLPTKKVRASEFHSVRADACSGRQRRHDEAKARGGTKEARDQAGAAKRQGTSAVGYQEAQPTRQLAGQRCIVVAAQVSTAGAVSGRLRPPACRESGPESEGAGAAGGGS
jgi:hypothetical protein